LGKRWPGGKLQEKKGEGWCHGLKERSGELGMGQGKTGTSWTHNPQPQLRQPTTVPPGTIHQKNRGPLSSFPHALRGGGLSGTDNSSPKGICQRRGHPKMPKDRTLNGDRSGGGKKTWVLQSRRRDHIREIEGRNATKLTEVS